MTGTLKAQLAQYDMTDRFDEVIHEIVQVRADLGHPVSATPFSQLIGIQSVLNVTTGERYKVVPDEVVLYVLGHYGRPPLPIDPDVQDRILDTPRGRELTNWQPPQPDIEEIRRAYGGPSLSDEELILRYLAPVEDIDATRAMGPIRRGYDFADDTSVPRIVEEILRMRHPGEIRLELPSMSLRVARGRHREH